MDVNIKIISDCNILNLFPKLEGKYPNIIILPKGNLVYTQKSACYWHAQFNAEL